MLARLFHDYYKDAMTWPKLWEALKNSNDFEFQAEVLSMTPEIMDDSIQCSNSGLTYNFAPIFIKEDIENFLRYKEPIDEYCFICEHPTQKEDICIQSGKIQHTLRMPDIWANWKAVADFISNIPARTYILGHANALNQMTSNPEFLESIKNVIGFVNSHGPAFLKTSLLNGFEFNDQMINWKSGANFRTCQYGNKHCLPIFAIKDGMGCNLLNLNRLWFPIDDVFELQGPCACGKPCVKFVSHIHNMPDSIDYDTAMKLPERLKSKLRWFQIVQDREFKLLYDTTAGEDLHPDDVVVINELTGTIPLYKENFLLIGGKIPPFWKIHVTNFL